LGHGAIVDRQHPSLRSARWRRIAPDVEFPPRSSATVTTIRSPIRPARYADDTFLRLFRVHGATPAFRIP
jgi:hypothetical protein